MAEEAKPQQVQIKADEKELLGQYSNLVMVHHNAEEFTLNFVYVFPSVPQGKLVSAAVVWRTATTSRDCASARRVWLPPMPERRLGVR